MIACHFAYMLGTRTSDYQCFLVVITICFGLSKGMLYLGDYGRRNLGNCH